MSPYCIKCLMLTKNNDIKIKIEIDGKINFYPCFNNCSFNCSFN